MEAAQAQRFLSEHFGRDVYGLTRFTSGEWSKAYAFTLGEQQLVARFSAIDDDFARDRLAMRWASRDLPIPRVLEIVETPGGFCAISERMPGTALDDLDETQVRATLPSLFAALDAIRTADLSATTGFGGVETGGNARFASWKRFLLDVATPPGPGDRLLGWDRLLASSPVGDGPFRAAYEQLERVVDGVPEARHLVHSDLLNRNVLVADSQISGVLDWGCATYGDFLYDVAWLSFCLLWYPQWAAIDFEDEARRHYDAIGLDVPLFDERLRAYKVHIGLGALKYNAFKQRWDEVERIARRTLECAGL